MTPPQTGSPPRGAKVVVSCPLIDCPWEYELGTARPVPVPGPVASLHELAREMAAAEARADDAALRSHLATHDVEDFLRSIASLAARRVTRVAGEVAALPPHAVTAVVVGTLRRLAALYRRIDAAGLASMADIIERGPHPPPAQARCPLCDGPRCDPQCPLRAGREPS